MTTLTLTLDDKIIEANRKMAAAQGKSLEQMITEYLASNAPPAAKPALGAAWAQEFLRIARESNAPAIDYKWNRADAYE